MMKTTKKIIRAAVLAAGLAALLASGCSKSTVGGSYKAPDADMPGLDTSLPATHQLALRRINQYRAAMGLPLWRYDGTLAAMGQAHAIYVNKACMANRFYACHYEDPANEGYTKEGDEAAQTSGIDFSGLDPVTSLENLLRGPYHRLQFTDPRPMRVAVASYNKNFCGATLFVTREDTAAKAEAAPRFILFPPKDFSDAMTDFFGEVPDPTKRVYPNITGTIVTINMNDADTEKFESASAVITDESGKPVDAWFAHPGAPAVTEVPEMLYKDLSASKKAEAEKQYSRNQNMVMIMPRQPLKPGTKYSVKADLTIGGKTEIVTWTFKTRDAITWNIKKKPSRPWESFAFAASQSSSGDVLQLDSGEYNLDFNCIIHKSITIRGRGIGKTIIRNADKALSSGMFYENKDQAFMLQQQARLTIEDLTLKGGTPLLNIEYGGKVLLRRFAIEPTAMYMYFFVNWGGELYLEDCDFSKVQYPLFAMLNMPTTVNFVPVGFDKKNYLAFGSTVPGGKLIIGQNNKIPNEQILTSYGGVVEKRNGAISIE